MADMSSPRRALALAADIASVLSAGALVVLAIMVGLLVIAQKVRVVPSSAQARPTAAADRISVVDHLATSSNEHAIRPSGARVAVVEFGDFQCPFCGRYARDTFPRIRRELVDGGQVAYVFRHQPSTTLHPLALKASQAAECAGDQGRYWPMHERLFAKQAAIDPSGLLMQADALGLDHSRFRKCLDAPPDATLENDIAEGQRLGVKGTPTFFIGLIQPDGQIDIRRRLVGIFPYEVFKRAIDDVASEALVARR